MMERSSNAEAMPLEICEIKLADYVFDSGGDLSFGEGAQAFGVPPREEVVLGTRGVDLKVIVEPSDWVCEVQNRCALCVLSGRCTLCSRKVESNDLQVVGVF